MESTDVFYKIFTNTLYLIALINPISKICILSAFAKDDNNPQEMKKTVIESSIIAFLILLLVMLFGEFIFKSFLRVELYSLRIAGGIILFGVGFKALSKGVFFETGTQHRLSEISIVPLASPMIAGPGTIAAALTLTVADGFFITVIGISAALLVNLALTLMSEPLGKLLTRFNVMGALIRLTGLVVTTIGTEMILNGIADWVSRLK